MPEIEQYRAEIEEANRAAKEAIRAQLIAAANSVVEADVVDPVAVVESLDVE